MRKLQRTPSDEILLTELAWDDKDVSIYDITSVILVGERASVQSPFGKLKCYLDHESKEFFIEINESTPLKVFTRSVLLNILDLAEREGAKKLYACLRRGTHNLEQFVKAFLFVGFMKLDEEEMKQVSMTQTHILVQYNLEEEEELI
jgi:hypothetical protein